MASNYGPASSGGEDRLSALPEGVLERVLSFLPATDAVRASVLSRRFRDAWTHAPALNLSDERHQDGGFLEFARAVLSRYGAPDIPALNVTISRMCNLGPGTAEWIRDAMERVAVDGSISLSVTAFTPLDRLCLPCCLRARSISLRLNGLYAGRRYGRLVPPEPPGTSAAVFGRLTELSLKMVIMRSLGEFLSSCCPVLRKLRLCQVSGGAERQQDFHSSHWQLVLHLQQLEELELESLEYCCEMQMVLPNLRNLVVRRCFFVRRVNHVQITASRLEAIYWSTDGFPSRRTTLRFRIDSGCVRRLAGFCFYLPGESFQRTPAVELLKICSSADHLSVSIVIQKYIIEKSILKKMGHVPQLPNIGVLYVQIVADTLISHVPIVPSIFAFLRRCPNLTRLHINLSMLHQFLKTDPLTVLVDSSETKGAKLWESSGCDPYEVLRDKLQLGSLREIRLSDFMGTDREMELADLLFGVGAARPALERISISLTPLPLVSTDDMSSPLPSQLLRHMSGIGGKVKAQFPLPGGCWAINPLKELTWSRMSVNC